MDASATAAASSLQAILRGLCPRCRRGAIFRQGVFRGFGAMNPECPVCGLRYEREQGYFLGAMYIGYGLALPLIAALAALIWAITRWTWDTLFFAALLAFLPLTPVLARMARVLWIHFDRMVDPDR
jgi:uncharacterized protein (DUF983 family)